MGGCEASQNEVDFRASHSRRVVEAHSKVIGVSLVVIFGEHVNENGFVILKPVSKERHRVKTSVALLDWVRKIESRPPVAFFLGSVLVNAAAAAARYGEGTLTSLVLCVTASGSVVDTTACAVVRLWYSLIITHHPRKSRISLITGHESEK